MLAPLPLRRPQEPHKLPQAHLFLRQNHTVQIIQLVEGPPPPRHTQHPVDSSASSFSSSECSDSDSPSESLCSSYCSSDLPPDQPDSPQCDDDPRSSTDTYSVRMKRILAWRENFCAHLSATLSEPSLSPSLKRKIQYDDDDDDNMSHSSKRSRSQASQGDASVTSLGMHSCPACDTTFPTPQSLQQHGRDTRANEACCVAVEYAFE